MLTNGLFSHLWHTWVDFVARLGLPLDRQVTAMLALVAVFWLVGYAFKQLVSK